MLIILHTLSVSQISQILQKGDLVSSSYIERLMSRAGSETEYACGLCLNVYTVFSIDERDVNPSVRCDILWGHVVLRGIFASLVRNETVR